MISTLVSPLLLAGSPWTRRSPRTAIVMWNLLFLSAFLAAFMAFVLACWIGFVSWFELRQSQIAGSAWFQVIGISFVPWVLLALFGISLALITERVEPAKLESLKVRELLQSGAKSTGTFGGLRLLEIQLPVPVAFTFGHGTSSQILVSSETRARLDSDEMEALLWHEVGHALRHHNRIKAIAAYAQLLAPFIRTSSIFQREIELLCELDADRFASTHVSQRVLQSAHSALELSC